jgi:hypothetical protein
MTINELIECGKRGQDMLFKGWAASMVLSCENPVPCRLPLRLLQYLRYIYTAKNYSQQAYKPFITDDFAQPNIANPFLDSTLDERLP